ncbi:unnamed protein product [Rangifer tarandus platyrhynchus]|uniref:Uncharacterized protein n=2 Tax=Rangifer tarandus platyrhynchus TaxID=3082113 RepID=A0ABN8XZJ0_RANTA|nr:unnamed protein product [Rangifer tarandus platyrhynchus]CAI9692559.1 unnamed protein product [Rangifer tarandus platyrhynchus]
MERAGDDPDSPPQVSGPTAAYRAPLCVLIGSRAMSSGRLCARPCACTGLVAAPQDSTDASRMSAASLSAPGECCPGLSPAPAGAESVGCGTRTLCIHTGAVGHVDDLLPEDGDVSQATGAAGLCHSDSRSAGDHAHQTLSPLSTESESKPDPKAISE